MDMLKLAEVMLYFSVDSMTTDRVCVCVFYLYKEAVGSSTSAQSQACRKYESGPENVNTNNVGVFPSIRHAISSLSSTDSGKINGNISGFHKTASDICPSSSDTVTPVCILDDVTAYEYFSPRSVGMEVMYYLQCVSGFTGERDHLINHISVPGFNAIGRHHWLRTGGKTNSCKKRG